MNRHPNPIDVAFRAGEMQALYRAARRAREVAARTGTPLVLYEDGKLVFYKVCEADLSLEKQAETTLERELQ